jgi:hypothetical protein
MSGAAYSMCGSSKGSNEADPRLNQRLDVIEPRLDHCGRLIWQRSAIVHDGPSWTYGYRIPPTGSPRLGRWFRARVVAPTPPSARMNHRGNMWGCSVSHVVVRPTAGDSISRLMDSLLPRQPRGCGATFYRLFPGVEVSVGANQSTGGGERTMAER